MEDSGARGCALNSSSVTSWQHDLGKPLSSQHFGSLTCQRWRQLYLLLENKMKALVAQSCPTLCNPMGCSLPGSSVCEILQARILEWVAMPSPPGDLPDLGIEPVSRIPVLVGGFFTTSATWEAPWVWYQYIFIRDYLQNRGKYRENPSTILQPSFIITILT